MLFLGLIDDVPQGDDVRLNPAQTLESFISLPLLSLEQTLLHFSRGIMPNGTQMQHSIVFSRSESM